MTKFQQEINLLYGCESIFITEKEVGFKLPSISKHFGVIMVQVYEISGTIHGHSGVIRCYAWDQNGEPIIVLGEGQVDSPMAAVEQHFRKNIDRGKWELISSADLSESN